MAFWQYAVISVLAYAGIAVGFFIIRVVPEERRQGEKYFMLLMNLLSLLAAASLFFTSSWILPVLLLAAFYLWSSPFVSYTAFSFVFALANERTFLPVTMLIFAYGLAYGAMLSDGKNKLRSIFACSYFVPLSMVIFMIILLL